jgi:hypothetical protein
MNPAFSAPKPPSRPFPVVRVVIAAGAAVVLFFAVMIIIESWPEHFDYELQVTDEMLESCFGGGTRFEGLSDVAEIESIGKPEVREAGAAIATYSCAWEWTFDQDIVASQSLTIDISVNSQDEQGGFSSILDQHQNDSDWSVLAEQVEGFEEGYCLLNNSGAESEQLECRGASDNLEVRVNNTSPQRSASTFGPQGLDIEELTAEVGVFARAAFRA